MNETKWQIVIGQKVDEGKVILAQRMREAMTPTEAILWKHLRGNKLTGLKFRRQQVIDGFIADFYCHAAGLVVEVDGPVHDPAYDAERDRILGIRQLAVLRITNEQVNNNLNETLKLIAEYAQARISDLPFPSEERAPRRGAGGEV